MSSWTFLISLSVVIEWYCQADFTIHVYDFYAFLSTKNGLYLYSVYFYDHSSGYCMMCVGRKNVAPTSFQCCYIFSGSSGSKSPVFLVFYIWYPLSRYEGQWEIMQVLLHLMNRRNQPSKIPMNTQHYIRQLKAVLYWKS